MSSDSYQVRFACELSPIDSLIVIGCRSCATFNEKIKFYANFCSFLVFQCLNFMKIDENIKCDWILSFLAFFFVVYYRYTSFW